MLVCQAGCWVEHRLGCGNAKPVAKSKSVIGNVQNLQANQTLALQAAHHMPWYGGDSVHSVLYRVILGIWRTEQAPQDFKQDILLPIPKKGDASLCSNYRTIALQSIAGKAYANVLSARLSEWLADNLLDEQCGFRPSRSTVDALFSLRLLCNGAWAKLCTYACWT